VAATRRRTTRRSASPTGKLAELDPVSIRLEFLAGLMLLKPDAKEGDRIALARSVGLDAAAVARIFRKTRGAAGVALHRAKTK